MIHWFLYQSETFPLNSVTHVAESLLERWFGEYPVHSSLLFLLIFTQLWCNTSSYCRQLSRSSFIYVLFVILQHFQFRINIVATRHLLMYFIWVFSGLVFLYRILSPFLWKSRSTITSMEGCMWIFNIDSKGGAMAASTKDSNDRLIVLLLSSSLKRRILNRSSEAVTRAKILKFTAFSVYKDSVSY